MQLALRIEEDRDHRELLALRTWLNRSDDLRGRAGLAPQGPLSPGDMGAGLDLINVVLSNGIALGSLVTAVATWRATRPGRPAVRVEVNGVTVTVDTDDPETLTRVTEALRGDGSTADS
ncbi:hypothetical protein [Streptomyces sp. NPDC001787]|uniref:effector-associated constant component EACC1 n=1 Tax=Streptomyces sp. NPDC001787 TaxID=3154523 RepID=UPI00332F9450